MVKNIIKALSTLKYITETLFYRIRLIHILNFRTDIYFPFKSFYTELGYFISIIIKKKSASLILTFQIWYTGYDC